MLRRIIAFVVAVAVLVILGSITQSLVVQHAWAVAAGHADGGAPVGIPYADRMAWIAHDFAGIFVSYGGVMAGTLLVALLVAAWLARFTGHRVVVYGVASAWGYSRCSCCCEGCWVLSAYLVCAGRSACHRKWR